MAINNSDKSVRLLRALQSQRSEKQRLAAYRRMVALKSGWWRRDPASKDEDFVTFLGRVSGIVIRKYLPVGASPTTVTCDELKHELFIVFFEKAASIRTDPRAWLFGTAVRILRDMVRRNAVVVFSQPLERVEEPRAAEPEPRSKPSPQLVAMRRAIRQLPGPTSRIVKAHIHGKTTADIAAELGLSLIHI